VALDQRGGNVDQRGFRRPVIRCHQCLEPRDLALHPCALFSETQHAQGVANLAQQIDLRTQFLGCSTATAHVDIEHILDLGQVFTDGRGHRLHQLDGRR
jgi:hypothetical protein